MQSWLECAADRRINNTIPAERAIFAPNLLSNYSIRLGHPEIVPATMILAGFPGPWQALVETGRVRVNQLPSQSHGLITLLDGAFKLGVID